MSSIYVFSGPCGCGKSTLADAYARALVDDCGVKQVYVIHGDDFHQGFVEAREQIGPACESFFYWPDILQFNWDCILHTAGKVLSKGVDVVIDYVVEEELPLIQELARQHRATLYYVVLTADQQTIRQRLIQRGNPELIERALFLKNKLENMPCNQGHLFDNTCKTVEQEIADLPMETFKVR